MTMSVSGSGVGATHGVRVPLHPVYARVSMTRRPSLQERADFDRVRASRAASGRKRAPRRSVDDGSPAERRSEQQALVSPRVLVVDGAREAAFALAGALDEAGMVALVEVDGRHALDRMQALRPDLVVTDVALPGLEGFDLAARLRDDPALHNVPVIFRTDRMETENVLRGLEVGGIDYIAKGRPLMEVVARIRTHLRMSHASQTMRLALDASHRPTIGVRPDGSILWHTPAAAALLSRIFVSWRPNDPLPQALREVLQALIQQNPLDGRRTARLGEAEGIQGEGGDLECIATGLTADGAMGMTLLYRRPGEEESRLGARHNLTTREAQVLFWIGRGKSNRDISEILGISARTVNKHLEQIFSKLGVENRASAAAIAVKTSSE